MSADTGAGNQDQLLGESDWDEQDLLTIDEATERLKAEIAGLRTRLEQQPSGADRDRTAGRLLLMERVLHSLQQGPSPLASTTRESRPPAIHPELMPS
jgi:hypothetical protein